VVDTGVSEQLLKYLAEVQNALLPPRLLRLHDFLRHRRVRLYRVLLSVGVTESEALEKREYLETRESKQLAWRILHGKLFDDFYSSVKIITMIKSRRMTLAGYVARMGERKSLTCW
jgi:hypothetical protein